MADIAECVAAGAAFLDEHDPDWWQRIELPTLDLSCEQHCVLGQTCPLEVLCQYAVREWGDAKEAEPDDRYLAYAFELSGAVNQHEVTEWAAERGFTLTGGHNAPWPDLTDEWKRVIAERRAAS